MKFILLQKKIPLECGKPLEFVLKIKFLNYFHSIFYSILEKFLQICNIMVKLILVLGFTQKEAKKISRTTTSKYEASKRCFRK